MVNAIRYRIRSNFNIAQPLTVFLHNKMHFFLISLDFITIGFHHLLLPLPFSSSLAAEVSSPHPHLDSSNTKSAFDRQCVCSG